MARQRFLRHAPVIEALIDIQVAPREGLTFAELDASFKDAIDGYYVKSPITEGRFGFKLPSDDTPPAAEARSAKIGLRMHSSDERYVLQSRLRGFTVSRLPPYHDWTELRLEAERLWRVYVEKLRPSAVTRIATRYINNLRLPMASGAPFTRYIENLVDLPDALPQLVASFVQRFQLRDDATDAQVWLTLALEPDQAAAQVPLILDIDAFQEIRLAASDPEVWNQLESLRILKNRCFFGTITEVAAELYE